MSAITNKQNTDASQANNISAVEETKTYYQKIADEYDSGKITDESIKAACEKQNPPVNPESILNYVHMTRLEREMSPYYKSDLSELKVEGTDYNGTLQDGETTTVAGCTITAKTYKGDDVKTTKNVFGLEALEVEAKKKKIYNDDRHWGYMAEYLGFDTLDTTVKESDYMPSERTLYHCSSPYLGEFDYDPTMYKIGYKEIVEKDGTKSQLPVLQYIGPNLSITKSVIMDTTYGSMMSSSANSDLFDTANKICNNLIPKGCKILDYTYISGPSANGSRGFNLEYVPNIPEGVESMNCSFKGCDGIKIYPAKMSGKGISGAFADVNESRVCILPSTLECASSTFQDCIELAGEFRTRGEAYANSHNYKENNHSMEVLIDAMYNKGLSKDLVDKLKSTFDISNLEIKDQLPSGIVNTLNMFAGCQGLDAEYRDGYDTSFLCFDISKSKSFYFDKAKFGGNLTPYLAPALARGIYDDIADSATLGRTNKATDIYFKDDNRITFIKDDGSVTSKSDLDEDKLNESRSAQIIIAEGKVDSAHVDTSVEVSSDGQRTNNKILDKNGAYSYDMTGLKKSYQKEVADTSAWWEKAAMMGVTGLSLYGIGKSTSDSKVIGLAAGVGGTLLLDKVAHVFPTSLYPIVSTTASLFSGKFGDKLQEWADKLPGAEAYKKNAAIREYNKEIEKYNKQWDNDYNLGKVNYKYRLSDLFESATTQARTSMLVDKECIKYMKENAKACVDECSFIAVAMAGEESAKCVFDTIEKTTNTAENGFTERFKGKTLTDSDKTEMKEYYMLLMDSLQAYSEGGIEKINTYDEFNVEKASLQKDGLGMVNRAYVDAAMTSLKEMNDKYNFMDDKAWKHLEGLSIEGVDMINIRNYSKTYFDEVKLQATVKTKTDVTNLAAVDKDFNKSITNELHAMEVDGKKMPILSRETIQIQESESDTSELSK